jgi:hypothetical protein
MMSAPAPATLLAVSAYFKLSGKRSHTDYLTYLRNFFTSIRCPCAFFTQESVLADLAAMNVYIPANITIHLFDATTMTAKLQYGEEFWRTQANVPFVKNNPQTPDLGMIWYEKKEFVIRASQLYPAFDAYAWCDAGCIRDAVSMNKALEFGLRGQPWVLDNRLHIQGVGWPPNVPALRGAPTQYVAGAILVGTKDAWTRYKTRYDSMLQEYVRHGLYCLDDQYVTVGCIVTHPDEFVLHTEPSAVDEWFKFLEKI